MSRGGKRANSGRKKTCLCDNCYKCRNRVSSLNRYRRIAKEINEERNRKAKLNRDRIKASLKPKETITDRYQISDEELERKLEIYWKKVCL